MRMKWSPLIGSLQQWWLTDSVWLVCLSTPSWLLLSCLCQLLILLFLKHVSKLFMNFKSWCKIISVIKWQVVHIKAQVINFTKLIWFNMRIGDLRLLGSCQIRSTYNCVKRCCYWNQMYACYSPKKYYILLFSICNICNWN